MDEAQFWSWIERLDGDADDEDSVADLTEELSRLPERDITDFEDHLARALHALDTPAHLEALGGFDDSFLYCRCAVVAAGRITYERVLAEPQDMADFADEDGEALLSVAPDAYERKTGMLWEHEPPVSYETGSNAAAWGSDAVDQPSEKWWNWLSVGSGYDVDVEGRPAYKWAEDQLTNAIDADPAWQKWWASAPQAELQLFPFYSNDGAPGTLIKKGRKRVEAQVTLDGRIFATTDRAALRRRAMDDVVAMLDAVRRELRLGPLPALPPVPDVPSDVPDEYEHDDDFDIDDIDEERLQEMAAQMGMPPAELRRLLADDDDEEGEHEEDPEGGDDEPDAAERR